MARLERYIDNVYGDDTWTGTTFILPAPGSPPGTAGPWASLYKACTTDPGAGNYFAIYLKNNNDLPNMTIKPYRRLPIEDPIIRPRYGGIDLNTPMEFHLNGSWLSCCSQVTGTWEKVAGTSYVYRTYLPSATTMYSLYVYGDDSYRGTLPGPAYWTGLTNIPLDSQNHSFYWDNTNKYLYICDWSGNPNTTNLHLEKSEDTHIIRMHSSSVKYHKLVGGIFYGFRNSMMHTTYEGLSVERCFVYGDMGFDNALSLQLNSNLLYSVVVGRVTASVWNAVAYIGVTGNKVYNNILIDSNYGVRFYPGAGAEVYNNIFLSQYISAYRFDGAYTLAEGNNAFGTLDAAGYGNSIGMIPEATDIYTFPGQQYGIFDKVLRYDGSSYTDVTSEAANDDASDFNLMGTSSHYIYFGHSEPFNGFLYDLSTNGSYGSLSWQYHSGNSVWATPYQARGDTAFNRAQGTVAFGMPTNWVKTSINGSEPLYWLRVKAGTVTTMALCKYIRINGSAWEYFCQDRDSFDLIPKNPDIINSTGYDWGYRDLDLIGNAVKKVNIGPYAVLNRVSRGRKYLEIEI